MNGEKCRDRGNKASIRQHFPSESIGRLIEDGELEVTFGRSNQNEKDPRCVFCGTYEDLKGHVDSEKSSEIFYLCGTCCGRLHG